MAVMEKYRRNRPVILGSILRVVPMLLDKRRTMGKGRLAPESTLSSRRLVYIRGLHPPLFRRRAELNNYSTSTHASIYPTVTLRLPSITLTKPNFVSFLP